MGGNVTIFLNKLDEFYHNSPEHVEAMIRATRDFRERQKATPAQIMDFLSMLQNTHQKNPAPHLLYLNSLTKRKRTP